MCGGHGRPGWEEGLERRRVRRGGSERVLPYSPGAGVTHRGMRGCPAALQKESWPRCRAGLVLSPSPSPSLTLSSSPSPPLLPPPFPPPPPSRRGGAGGAAPFLQALCSARARSPPRRCCPGAEAPLGPRQRERRAAGHLAGR